MQHLKFSILAAFVAVGLAGTAQAQAQDLDDRWEISGSYFQPKTEFDLRARGSITDGVDTVSASDRAGISDRVRGGHLDASFRLSPRQRVMLGGYHVSGDRHYGQAGAGSYTDGTDTYDYAYDATGRLDTEFELYRLGYGFDLIQNEQWTLTGLASVYGAKLQTEFTTGGVATVDGTDYDLSSRASLNEHHYAPGFGLSAEWRPADKWDVRASVQGFRTQWGDFKTDGHFTHANAQVGYKFTPDWTGFVGYDWFELELDDDFSETGTYDGVDYTANLRTSARLRVHGPALGVRYSF